jgi:hypothetical protein
LRAPAATLPASVVRKNLRRVQFSIALPRGKKQIFTSRVILLVCAQHSAWQRGRQGKGASPGDAAQSTPLTCLLPVWMIQHLSQSGATLVQEQPKGNR